MIGRIVYVSPPSSSPLLPTSDLVNILLWLVLALLWLFLSTDRYGMEEFSQWTPEWSLNRPISLTNQFDFNTISRLSDCPPVLEFVLISSISFRTNNYPVRKSRLYKVYFKYILFITKYIRLYDDMRKSLLLFFPRKHLCSLMRGNFRLVYSVWCLCLC